MRYLIVALVIFGFGSLVGSATTTPEVEYIKGRTVTKTVTKESEPVIVERIPEACMRAIELAYDIIGESEDFYDVGQEQLDIISDVRAIMAGAKGDLSTQENIQRQLSGDAVDSLYNLEEIAYDFEIVYTECEDLQ